jgi:hypothetical protein
MLLAKPAEPEVVVAIVDLVTAAELPPLDACIACAG